MKYWRVAAASMTVRGSYNHLEAVSDCGCSLDTGCMAVGIQTAGMVHMAAAVGHTAPRAVRTHVVDSCTTVVVVGTAHTMAVGIVHTVGCMVGEEGEEDDHGKVAGCDLDQQEDHVMNDGFQAVVHTMQV